MAHSSYADLSEECLVPKLDLFEALSLVSFELDIYLEWIVSIKLGAILQLQMMSLAKSSMVLCKWKCFYEIIQIKNSYRSGWPIWLD